MRTILKTMLTIAVVAAASLVALASPVRSELGGVAEGDEMNQPVNLWTWPTEWAVHENINPSKVWTPMTGVWYASAAANGYFQSNKNTGGVIRGRYFSAESFHNVNDSWYQMVQFFALEPGEYELSCDYECEIHADDVGLSIMCYRESGEEFVLSRYFAATKIGVITDHGDFKTGAWSFRVESEDAVVGIWLGVKNHVSDHNEADIWNVWLEKVGE